MPPPDYIQILFEEIRQKHQYFKPQVLDTLYFGGGTPSLIDAHHIVAIIKELAKYGFTTGRETEVTIEINPATVSTDKLKIYMDHGINRFSVGAQTFDDKLLKMVHREHNAKQTLETLDLLRANDLNFSFDILFALPTQTIEGLARDVDMALDLGAKHLSPYCLTVPENHPLAKGRAIDEEQVDMFELITEKLTAHGYEQYEISNFAQPGFESRHNLLYWIDQPYWGLGLSSHSNSHGSKWGTRFWNLNSIGEYQKQILSQQGQQFSSPEIHLPAEQFETLEIHQSLTDFCHTSLRLMRGLSDRDLLEKFSSHVSYQVLSLLKEEVVKGRVRHVDGHWSLTQAGLVISNQVFRNLTFLAEDLERL